MVGGAPRRGWELLDRERPTHENFSRSAGPIDTENRDRPPGPDRPDAVEELQEAEPCELVARIVGEAEQADHVLHVRGLEEAQTAVLHVRNASNGQFELEEVAVVRGTDQNRLFSQCDAVFAMREYLFANRVDLRVLVGAAHEA